MWRRVFWYVFRCTAPKCWGNQAFCRTLFAMERFCSSGKRHPCPLGGIANDTATKVSAELWLSTTRSAPSRLRTFRNLLINCLSIDAALPLEVDDEYFDEACLRWKQPHGKVRSVNGDFDVTNPEYGILKPSRISAFNQYVKLTGHMVLAAKRTLPSNLPPSNAGPGGHDLQSDLSEWHSTSHGLSILIDPS